MKHFVSYLAVLIALSIFIPTADAQRVICENGQCRIVYPPRIVSPPIVGQRILPRAVFQQQPILLDPLQEELYLEPAQLQAFSASDAESGITQVVRATVRVTVGGVCGSGTVVGRDTQGNAIVLTNAHVAGTSRGRIVNLERWDADGTSERGTGSIVAAGYSRGMSLDFALLKCSPSFAQTVSPIPLADRYPDTSSTVTTYGCPRCEWPSLQVLNMNRAEGQILTWKPEAIGGRSGSSLIDHTAEGPRVVGLLTWAGGGQGLGQSTPFLLSAMRGKLPTTIESLPLGVREVNCLDGCVYQVPASIAGEPLKLPVQLALIQVEDETINSILEKEKPKPGPKEKPANGLAQPESPARPFGRWGAAETAVTSSLLTLLLVLGVPSALRAIRQLRIDSGKSPLLSDEQFQQLVDSLIAALGGIGAGTKGPPQQ